jgi:hypothetical protein
MYIGSDNDYRKQVINITAYKLASQRFPEYTIESDAFFAQWFSQKWTSSSVRCRMAMLTLFAVIGRSNELTDECRKRLAMEVF